MRSKRLVQSERLADEGWVVGSEVFGKRHRDARENVCGRDGGKRLVTVWVRSQGSEREPTSLFDA